MNFIPLEHFTSELRISSAGAQLQKQSSSQGSRERNKTELENEIKCLYISVLLGSLASFPEQKQRWMKH